MASLVGRTKQTARKSTGGTAPRKQLGYRKQLAGSLVGRQVKVLDAGISEWLDGTLCYVDERTGLYTLFYGEHKSEADARRHILKVSLLFTHDLYLLSLRKPVKFADNQSRRLKQDARRGVFRPTQF